MAQKPKSVPRRKNTARISRRQRELDAESKAAEKKETPA